MHKTPRFAIVITHTGRRNRLLDMPWLETDYQIDESDWVVLSDEGWRAVAEGDATIWDALERKLLIGFYVGQPHLIAVIGHPSGRETLDARDGGEEEVRRIVRHIRSLLLPAAVLGFWTDESGSLLEIIEPTEYAAKREHILTEESFAMTDYQEG